VLRLLLLLLLAALLACAPRRDVVATQVDDCPAVLSDKGLPASPEEAHALRNQGVSWTDQRIREMYVCRVARIAAEDAARKAASVAPEARARAAYETRRNVRLVARAMMSDAAAVDALRARDLEKYGYSDGPTWDWLVERARDRGLVGDAVYESIIESAQRTDAATNRAFGL
jgi:hypothetical protein